MDTQLQQDPQNDSIDLIALLKKLWAGKKTIIKTTLVFFCHWVVCCRVL